MLRLLSCCCFWLLFQFPILALEVHILDWGIEGYTSRSHVARALVAIGNTGTENRQFQLMFRLHPAEPNVSVRTVLQRVLVGPGQTHLIEAPLPVSRYINFDFLEVEVRHPDGGVLGRATRTLEPIGPSQNDIPIGLYCQQDGVCRELQTQITFSGSIEQQGDKAKYLRVVGIRYPPRQWWGYFPLDYVLLAQPLDALNDDQRLALENFVRSGGHLILIESQVADKTFLRNYRQRPPAGEEQRIGLGSIIRVSTIGHLGSRFVAMKDFKRAAHEPEVSINDPLGYLQQRVGTVYLFPSLLWLLSWLCTFLLAVGPLNFAVLRRLRRPELGWVTIPAISLVFAALLYFASLARRPSDASLDEISISEMDDRGVQAVVATRVRVSSPTKANLKLRLEREAILSNEYEPGDYEHHVGGRGRNYYDLGPPLELDYSLRHLSYAEATFLSVQEFPGTLQKDGSRLLNRTGKSFRDALYITQKHLYFLGPLAAGSAVVLDSVRHEALADHAGRNLFWSSNELDRRLSSADFGQESERLRHRAFSLVEFVEAWSRDSWNQFFKSHDALFLGVSEDAALTAQLHDRYAARKRAIIIAVRFVPEP